MEPCTCDTGSSEPRCDALAEGPARSSAPVEMPSVGRMVRCIHGPHHHLTTPQQLAPLLDRPITSLLRSLWRRLSGGARALDAGVRTWLVGGGTATCCAVAGPLATSRESGHSASAGAGSPRAGPTGSAAPCRRPCRCARWGWRAERCLLSRRSRASRSADAEVPVPHPGRSATPTTARRSNRPSCGYGVATQSRPYWVSAQGGRRRVRRLPFERAARRCPSDESPTRPRPTAAATCAGTS